MDYITFRKKTKSQNDLSCLSEDSEEETSFNCSHFNNSITSLPNICSKNGEVNELKRYIKQLKLDLEGAHAEIENLTLENSDLKNKLSQYIEKLNLYKQLGVSENLCKSPKHQEKQLRSQKNKKLKSENIVSSTP